MAKESGKTARTGFGRKPPPRARRATRRPKRPLRERLLDALSDRALVAALGVFLVFVVLAAFMVAASRDKPFAPAGRIAEQTRTVRVEFQQPNAELTRLERDSARQEVPRVYRAIDSALAELEDDLRRLPAAAAGADQADAELLARAGVSDERAAWLRSVATDPVLDGAWESGVAALAGILRRSPLLEGPTWERAVSEGRSRQVELIVGEQSRLERRDQAVNIDEPDQLAERAARWAGNAGFADQARDAVAAVLVRLAQPTFRFDAVLTSQREDAAAAEISPISNAWANGQTIVSRGELITPAQAEVIQLERQHHREHLRETDRGWRIWATRLAAAAAVVCVSIVLAGYLALEAPRIVRSPAQLVAVAAVTLLGLAAALLMRWVEPGLVVLAAVAPAVQIAVLLAIAHDQRTAMAVGSVSAVLIGLALDLPLAAYALSLLGVGVAVWKLAEIRDRRALVGLAGWTGAALAVGAALVLPLSLPLSADSSRQILADALLAGFGGLLTGGLTLFVLPLIERAFGITTGMTLIELRDPKNPLLRDLQRAAPGTYNHSLNVASIAEAAADAIGADSLLTYVGCLYHDIGKLTKPQYFVENQSGGPNRHDKLSPAMSVLVIVGHVKDGLELAREAGLPRPLHHFIEGHHGTTLVEFFFNRARAQAQNAAEADAQDDPRPEEVDYRYPGPKPRTKEVAITMLSDTVESAARAMTEPNPSRIDQLVRDLANKRLMDGQFDECDLSLRELHLIVESISKSVTAIYHGRIKYDAPAEKPADAREQSA